MSNTREDVFPGNEITAFEQFLIFKLDDKLEILDFIDEINPGDVELVKVYAHIMEMKLLSHRFDDNFDLKPLLENLYFKNQIFGAQKSVDILKRLLKLLFLNA